MSAQLNNLRHYDSPYREPRSLAALYQHVLERGRQSQSWWMLGRGHCLLSLESVLDGKEVVPCHDAGLQVVAIDRILGSEGRAHDFDCGFNPLHDLTRDRWLAVASAMQRGQALPPVCLIQVAGRYFVRDGHHRISVARALGQETIAAHVVVWRTEERSGCGQIAQKTSSRQGGSRAPACSRARGARRASILGWVLGIVRPAGREAAR